MRRSVRAQIGYFGRKWGVCWIRKEGREEEGDDLGIYRGIESLNGRSIEKRTVNIEHIQVTSSINNNTTVNSGETIGNCVKKHRLEYTKNNFTKNHTHTMKNDKAEY